MEAFIRRVYYNHGVESASGYQGSRKRRRQRISAQGQSGIRIDTRSSTEIRHDKY